MTGIIRPVRLKVSLLRGEVVSFHLFDVGGTLDTEGLRAAVGSRAAPAIGKGTPAYVEFPQPVIVSHAPVEIDSPTGPLVAEATVAYFELGVLSLRLRTPVEVDDVERLVGWTRSKMRVGDEWRPLEAGARALVNDLKATWEPHVRERYTHRVLYESYTVFAFQDVGQEAPRFLQHRASAVAGLLKGEPGARLHEKEVKESLRSWFSYYADDAIVVEWDAALIVDPDRDYEDLLFVLELANLQLLEFRAYDVYLDELIARAYDELGTVFRRPSLFRNVRKTVHELSLVRMEISELADEVDNITKFLGDWYLARVYQAAQVKFHIGSWRATVDDKLGTINKLYQLANEESDSRRMITLELMIVLLFILDLAVIFFAGKG